MSYNITFDTLAFVKKLEASGIEAKQFEAITEAVGDAFENSRHCVANKMDKLSVVQITSL